MPERRIAHVSQRPHSRPRAVWGFDASATGVPEGCPPVELSIPAGYYARCLEAYMHSEIDAPGTITVNLQYSLDDWNTSSGSRTWNAVFQDGTRLVLTSSTQQMQGPIKRFAPFPQPLDLRNEWAGEGGEESVAKRVLIRPNVEGAGAVFVVAELIFELWKIIPDVLHS